MTDAPKPVLDARGLGKAYALSMSGSQKRRSRDIWSSIFQRKPKQITADEADLFWAVRDVSLCLMPGESLGVIGRNGAGKTTLMKMLSGILPPDTGTIAVRGEIQAMVNLSGGIDKTLSGRQNIINAAALRGLSTKQTRARVDEIIAFAELENAIDRHVSTYSSGMKARLGFAICVHMDPALIVIDEALAVGDTRFKQKCLRRLNEMRGNGVSMVLVSHSVTQIRQFCERTIWINDGQIMADGPSAETIKAYQDYLDALEVSEDEDNKDQRKSEAKARAMEDLETGKIPEGLDDLNGRTSFIRNISPFGPILLDRANLTDLSLHIRRGLDPVSEIEPNEALDFTYAFTLARPVNHLNLSLIFYDEGGARLSAISSLDGNVLEAFKQGRVAGQISVRDMPFPPGRYHVVVAVHDGSEHLFRHRMGTFRVRAGDRGNWPVPIFLGHSHVGFEITSPQTGEAPS